jgi:hypothetical protein
VYLPSRSGDEDGDDEDEDGDGDGDSGDSGDQSDDEADGDSPLGESYGSDAMAMSVTPDDAVCAVSNCFKCFLIWMSF